MPGETYLHPEGAFLTGRGYWQSKGPNPETVLNIFLSVSVCLSLCAPQPGEGRTRAQKGPEETYKLGLYGARFWVLRRRGVNLGLEWRGLCETIEEGPEDPQGLWVGVV